ncbi:MAG: Trp family transcriptional regulator [Planctomycetota bacterium]
MSRNDTLGLQLSLADICAVLCNISEPDQMQEFLTEMLTPSECRDLSLRWELMRRLKKGVSQRQIAKELGISLCKITRGAKILKQDHSISKHYLNTGEKDESKNPTG